MATFTHDNPKFRTGVLGYEGTKIKETEKAVCFKIGNGNVWFPKAALKYKSESSIEVARWFKYDERVWKIIEPVCVFFA